MMEESKIENYEHHDSDSDSEDDHEFYGNPESTVGAFAKDSMKTGHHLGESHLGSMAADSLKIHQPAPHTGSKFSFHNFGFHPTPFTDLLKTFTTMRNSYSEAQAAYESEHQATKARSRSPKRKSRDSGNKLFNIKEFQKTQSKTRKNHKISQFRETSPKWDMSAPDEQLLKALYRSCDSDPTGRRIFNLSRDEAKGTKPWRPTETDKDIPIPHITTLSPSFQKMLLKHIDHIVKQVEEEYKNLPEKTQVQSEIKAGVGADLANLRRRRQELYNDVNIPISSNDSNK